MKRLFTCLADITVSAYTLFAVYYLVKLLLDVYRAIQPPYDITFFTGNIIGFILVYGLVIGGHALLSLWMYWDLARRPFQSDRQRIFWLTVISAGLAPVYYYVHGRKLSG